MEEKERYDLKKENQQLKEKLKVVDNFMFNYGYSNYDYGEILEDLQTRAFQAEDDTKIVEELLDYLNLRDENKILSTIKQSQKQLAIEELKGLRDKICDIGYDEDYNTDYFEVMKEIDNQIKELKGEE